MLRMLVTVLTVVMIVGFIIMIIALVTRLQRTPEIAFDLPDAITLPDGSAPLAFTRGPDWIAITTEDRILIYSPDGTLKQSVDLD